VRYCENTAVALGLVKTVCQTIICEIIICDVIICKIVTCNIIMLMA
jgi:hypothetical protein